MTDSIKPVRISGDLFWTKWMGEFNKAFNEDNTKYECTIGNLSDPACEALKKLGVKIKNKEGQGNFIVAKSNYSFDPVDEDGIPIEQKLLGSGTKVVALVGSYTHKLSQKHGNAPSIKKLIITELKTYKPVVDMPEDEDEYIL